MKRIAIISGFLLCYTMGQAQDWASITIPQEAAVNQPEEDPNEGKVPISQQEVPDEVIQAFKTSVFQHMEIVQVFRLQDQALDEITVGKEVPQPFYLYELRLTYEGKSFYQYFTPNGDLYERLQPV